MQVSLFAWVSITPCWDLVHSGWKCKITSRAGGEKSLQTAPLYLYSIDCRHFCHSKCSTVYLAFCPLFVLHLVIRGDDVKYCIMSIEWGKGTIASIFICGTGSPVGANIPVSIKISSLGKSLEDLIMCFVTYCAWIVAYALWLEILPSIVKC